MAREAAVAVAARAVAGAATHALSAAVLGAVRVVAGPLERAARALDHLRQAGNAGFVINRVGALGFRCFGG
jgi:hypothetical protein